MPTAGKATLTQFLIEERRRAPGATGDLNALITDVSLACKAISCRVAYGALGGDERLRGITGGATGSAAPTVNVQGETQKALDVISNDIFLFSIDIFCLFFVYKCKYRANEGKAGKYIIGCRQLFQDIAYAEAE